MKSLSRVQLFATPWTVAHQAPPSMGFTRQEYWSGLPFLSPGNLPNPGIEPRSLTLQADALTSEPPGKWYKWRHLLSVENLKSIGKIVEKKICDLISLLTFCKTSVLFLRRKSFWWKTALSRPPETSPALLSQPVFYLTNICMKESEIEVSQSCPTVCDLMGGSRSISVNTGAICN